MRGQVSEFQVGDIVLLLLNSDINEKGWYKITAICRQKFDDIEYEVEELNQNTMAGLGVGGYCSPGVIIGKLGEIGTELYK